MGDGTLAGHQCNFSDMRLEASFRIVGRGLFRHSIVILRYHIASDFKKEKRSGQIKKKKDKHVT